MATSVLSVVDCDLFSPHCMKSVQIRSFSGPYFPAFKLNTERYGVSVHGQRFCSRQIN